MNFPSANLPTSSQLTFGEILDVNYSQAFVNQTLAVQSLNGTSWAGIAQFRGNEVGFTEIDYGINSAWAKFGENNLRVVSGSCNSNVLAIDFRYDPTAFQVDLLSYAVMAVLASLFFLVGRRLGWGRFLFVALAAYLALAPWTGQRYDVYFLLSSGIRILQHVNPFDPGNPPLYPGPLKWAYPPLYAAYSAVSFLVYQGLTGSQLPSVASLTWPGWLTATYNVYQAYVPQSLPVLVLLLKLPMVAAAILTGVLLKRMTGSDRAAVWWIANPLVILVAAIWGQLDPIATLFAVGSIYYYEQGKMYHSYLFASIGAAVKVWPVLLIPILFVVSLRRNGTSAVKPLAAVLPALLVTLGLYGIFGNVLESLFVFVYARGIPTFAGAFSVNGLTWQQALFAVGSPPVPVFLYAGIPVYVVMLVWAYWKNVKDVVLLLAASILLLFLTYNYVNPQYFYWIIPLLVLQRRKLAAAVFTALPLVFMLGGYDIFYFVSPALLHSEFEVGASIIEQMKVSLFYQSQVIFLTVSAVVPTIAYLILLYAEFRGGRDAPTGTGKSPSEVAPTTRSD